MSAGDDGIVRVTERELDHLMTSYPERDWQVIDGGKLERELRETIARDRAEAMRLHPSKGDDAA